jgi:hypothetical protein
LTTGIIFFKLKDHPAFKETLKQKINYACTALLTGKKFVVSKYRSPQAQLLPSKSFVDIWIMNNSIKIQQNSKWLLGMSIATTINCLMKKRESINFVGPSLQSVGFKNANRSNK